MRSLLIVVITVGLLAVVEANDSAATKKTKAKGKIKLSKKRLYGKSKKLATKKHQTYESVVGPTGNVDELLRANGFTPGGIRIEDRSRERTETFQTGIQKAMKTVLRGVKKTGFEPDIKTINENLQAFAKTIVGKAVAAVDYEAKKAGSVVADQMGKLTGSYIDILKSQRQEEEAFLDHMGTNYGKINRTSLRAKIQPSIDSTLEQIPEKNIGNIAKSLTKSVIDAVDGKLEKWNYGDSSVSDVIMDIKHKKKNKYQLQKKVIEYEQKELEALIDRHLGPQASGKMAPALSSLAKKLMRKCEGVPARKKACLAKIKQIISRVEAGQAKTAKAALQYLTKFQSDVAEAGWSAVAEKQSGGRVEGREKKLDRSIYVGSEVATSWLLNKLFPE